MRKTSDSLLQPENRPGMSMAESFAAICHDLIRFLPDQYPAIDPKSSRKSILIETRDLIHLEFVIKNTILKLGDGWGHMIFCSADNLGKVSAICQTISAEIEIVLLHRNIHTINDYNELCLDPLFWEKIHCEKVLIYQADTFVFKDLEPGFLEYDFIGAPWGPGFHADGISRRLGLDKQLLVGNGGLSLRNVSLIKKALADENWKSFQSNTVLDATLDKIPEDVFFAAYCARYGKVADVPTALGFSFEKCFGFKTHIDLTENAFGAHKVYDFFTDEKDLQAYLESYFFSSLISKNLLATPIGQEIFGYIHVACIGTHWQTVFQELWDGITANGLYENTAGIFVCVSGSEADFRTLQNLFTIHEKLVWKWNGQVIDRFEYPTLDFLHAQSIHSSPHKIWYVHTKGVSTDYDNPYYKYWRRTMIDSNLREWQKHCFALDEHDTSGESWCEEPGYPKHYSGNFWWANAAFISQLKPMSHYWENPREDWRMVLYDRFQPEMWLSTENVKAKSFGIYNPIRFRDKAGMGFSHFILSLNLDPVTCTLNQVAVRKCVIRLNENQGRHAKCQMELQRIGLENVSWLNTAFPADFYPDRIKRTYVENWIRHSQALENADRDQVENVLVMEDDVVFANGFNEIFNYCFPQVPADWEMIWIGYAEAQGYAHVVNDFTAIPGKPFGTHCYLLSAAGIRKVLQNLRDGMKGPIDVQISMTKGLKQYEIIPALAYKEIQGSKRHPFAPKVVFGTP